MNILFLTIGGFSSIYKKSLYTDLMRSLMNKGNNVYIVSSIERRENKDTGLINEGNCKLLKVKIGNITQTNLIEKGVSTVLITKQYQHAINTFFKGVKFDLILYSTPPITLCGVVKYLKNRDNAKTYLILKDIFPQNAVDLGMMSKTGVKSSIYKYFRQKEKELYKISDKIGCMSKANVDYILRENTFLDKNKVEVFPNCIEIQDVILSQDEKIEMRKKYNIPLDKTVFVYGGNLGRPQNIPFIIECIKSQRNNKDVFFLIAGDGTEFNKLKEFEQTEKIENFKLFKNLPKEDYDRMVASCDVGLIFLDYRFTIPNYPSRLLPYMQAGLPVLACTDKNTDIGKFLVDNKIGWWCFSNSVSEFDKVVKLACQEKIKSERVLEVLRREYSVEKHIDKLLNW